MTGSCRETDKVAHDLDLPIAEGPTPTPLVVVTTSRADVEAVRAAVARSRGAIAAVVALRLPEDQAVAVYDLGVPIVFGFCAWETLRDAMAATPDVEGRSIAATLASVEQAIGVEA
ncbi:MAG: hypothetical protein ACYDH6_20010 [Acidimicrobiales bacterium]